MKHDTLEKEYRCLVAKHNIDQLRTSLFQIEDFKDFSYWDKKLNRLKSLINDIYWQL